MGSVVKAITKPFKGLAQAVGGVLGVGSQPQAPQVVSIPTQQPTAVQVSDTPAAAPDKEVSEGTTTERAQRRGKRGLTIRRTGVGGGSGTNI